MRELGLSRKQNPGHNITCMYIYISLYPRCIVPFPASSEYEVSLQLGDVVTLVKRREDGWCKGTHHRSAQYPESECHT